jgi:hypothetical protein
MNERVNAENASLLLKIPISQLRMQLDGNNADTQI